MEHGGQTVELEALRSMVAKGSGWRPCGAWWPKAGVGGPVESILRWLLALVIEESFGRVAPSNLLRACNTEGVDAMRCEHRALPHAAFACEVACAAYEVGRGEEGARGRSVGGWEEGEGANGPGA